MGYISKIIVDYLSSLYGEKLTRSYQELINQEPAQYIRINALKISVEELKSALKQKYEIGCSRVSNYANILRVKDENNLIGKTLEHILGCYYIQSYSSFIPPIVLNPSEDNIILDLCAAPGSKTTELGEIMNNKGTIITNEVQLDRLKSLVHNIERMNQINAGIIHYKGEQLSTIYSNYFDKIIVDAPCSGLGIIQKKNEVNDWWSLQRVNHLAELQHKLLVSAIKMLKVGGEIVYSTCTLTVEENELMLDKILRKYPVQAIPFEISIPANNGLTYYNNQQLNPSLINAKRILPWEVESDGFFIVKLKKIDKAASNIPKDLQLREIKFVNYDNKLIKNYLKEIEDEFGIKKEILSMYKFIIKGKDIFFVNHDWSDPNTRIFERIGLRFGAINKDDKIIFDSQAVQVLSKHITKRIIEIKPVSNLEIYLKGGIIKTILSVKGQHVVKHENYTLGTAVSTQGGLKSQFPRPLRTQTIKLVI